MDRPELNENIKRIIYEELPRIVSQQPELKSLIFQMIYTEAAPRKKTEDRFEKMLSELQEQKKELKLQREEWNKRFEESDRRFAEHSKRLDEFSRRFEESDRRFAEHSRRLDEYGKRFEEYDKRFAEHSRRLDEFSRRFEEHDKRFEASDRRFEEMKRESDERFEKLLNKIGNVDRRIDRTLGALGARWGLSSEYAFREAIKSVFKEFTNLRVEHYISYDKKGDVFGGPEQVEIDVVLKNGSLWLMEIKSSISKPEVYTFIRKAEFYEKEKGRKADRLIIVSPMFNPDATVAAEKLGIETYSAPEDIKDLQ